MKTVFTILVSMDPYFMCMISNVSRFMSVKWYCFQIVWAFTLDVIAGTAFGLETNTLVDEDNAFITHCKMFFEKLSTSSKPLISFHFLCMCFFRSFVVFSYCLLLFIFIYIYI